MSTGGPNWQAGRSVGTMDFMHGVAWPLRTFEIQSKLKPNIPSHLEKERKGGDWGRGKKKQRLPEFSA